MASFHLKYEFKHEIKDFLSFSCHLFERIHIEFVIQMPHRRLHVFLDIFE
jgi:hypothetical protein